MQPSIKEAISCQSSCAIISCLLTFKPASQWIFIGKSRFKGGKSFVCSIVKFKKSSERKLQDFFFSVYKVLANEIIEIIAEIFRGGLIVKPVEKTVTPTCQLIRELIRDKSSTALRNWDFLTDTVSSTGVLPSSFFIIAHTKAADIVRVVYLQEYIKQHKNFSSYAKLNNILEDCQVWPISLSRDLLLFWLTARPSSDWPVHWQTGYHLKTAPCHHSRF